MGEICFAVGFKGGAWRVSKKKMRTKYKTANHFGVDSAIFDVHMIFLHRNGTDMWCQIYSNVWSNSCSVNVCFQLHQIKGFGGSIIKSDGLINFIRSKKYKKTLIVKWFRMLFPHKSSRIEEVKIQSSEWMLFWMRPAYTYIHVQCCEMYHFPWSIDLTPGHEIKHDMAWLWSANLITRSHYLKTSSPCK